MDKLEIITTMGRIDRLTVAAVKAGRGKDNKGRKFALFGRVEGKWSPLAECAKPADADSDAWTRCANSVGNYDDVMALMGRAAECCGIVLGADLTARIDRAKKTVEEAAHERELKRIAKMREIASLGKSLCRDKGAEAAAKRFDRIFAELAALDAAADSDKAEGGDK